MSNSRVSTDNKYTTVEVTDCLKIPFCTDKELLTCPGRERELRFNTTQNTLMVKTTTGWLQFSLAEHLNMPDEVTLTEIENNLKTPLGIVDVLKDSVYVDMQDVLDENTLVENLEALRVQAKKHKLKKIKLNNIPTHKDRLLVFLKTTKYKFKTNSNGVISLNTSG